MDCSIKKLPIEHEVRTLIAKQFCNEIGCSGLSPDMCKDHPLDCSIVKKVMKGKDEQISD